MVAACLVLTASASAVTVTLPATQDCGVSAGAWTATCGSTVLRFGQAQQKVWVCTDTCAWQNKYTPARGLVAFDVSSIPASADITSATLHMHTTSTGRSEAVYVTAAPSLGYWTSAATWWDEDTSVPWQVPGGNPAAVVSQQRVTTTASAVDLDVSRPVREWVAGVAFNFGLVIAADDSLTQVTVDSADAAVAANRPTLTVTYAPGTPPSATLGGSLYADRDVNLSNDDVDGSYVSSDEQVTVAATEGAAGLGIASIELLVDGTRLRPEHLTTVACSPSCPATANATFTVPVASVAEGDHAISVVVRDRLATATTTFPGGHVLVKRFGAHYGPASTYGDWTPPAGLAAKSATPSASPSASALTADEFSVRSFVAEQARSARSDLGGVLGGVPFTVKEIGYLSDGVLPDGRPNVAGSLVWLRAERPLDVDRVVDCVQNRPGLASYRARLTAHAVTDLLVTADVTRGRLMCVQPGPDAGAWSLVPLPGQQLAGADTPTTYHD